MNMFLKKLLSRETAHLVIVVVSLLLVLFLFAPSGFAGNDPGSLEGSPQDEGPAYQPLAPLPGIEGDGDVTASEYFSTIYQIGVSLALVFAVVMLIYGGIQYMTSDSIGGKSGGRETIGKAIIGIVLAVSSYALLYLIGGVGSVTVGFDMPEGIEYVAPPLPAEQEGAGTPLECYASRARSASTNEKGYYCGPDVEENRRILFKLPFPGESGESYDEPGACYQVEESDVLDIANEECQAAGGELEELPYYSGSRDYLYGYYCFTDATEDECTNILEGEFASLEGMTDTMWDQSFCDARGAPTEGTTAEQRAEFEEFSRQFFSELIVGSSYQTSGYYTDEIYKDGEEGTNPRFAPGGGTHWHTGIDIGTGGQPSMVRSPVSGTFYVLREPGFNGYDDNGKFAIVEGEFTANPRVWVFTHVDGFSIEQHGQPVYKGDIVGNVGQEPCFPTVGGTFQCDMGPHLDLNIYSDIGMLAPPNDPKNWSESYVTSGRHPDQTTIAGSTMCPFQAYWESTNGI